MQDSAEQGCALVWSRILRACWRLRTRSSPTIQLNQAVALIARGRADGRALLRERYRLLSIFQRFLNFILLVEGDSQPENRDRIRVLRVSVDRFPQGGFS